MELLLLLPSHLIISILLLILPSSSSSSSSSDVITAIPKHGNLTDLEALLNFRDDADPHGILASNWTTNASSFCDWHGVFCSRRRQRVTAIRLFNISLQGTISPHLGNLSFLSYLYLSNLSLTGPIPESIGYLPRLAHLTLQINSLSGRFPPNIFNMSSLLYLYIAFNNLSGSLTSNNNSFTMPPRLRKISLGGNRFTDTDVLSSFLQCPDIQMVDLSESQFRGNIPGEIGGLSKLSNIYLGMNLMIGAIPSSLGNLTKLTELDLGFNNFSGIIPKELGNLANLQFLSLTQNHNIIGSIPTSLLNLSMLSIFDLGGNKLTGSVPRGIGNSLPMLELFHVGGNQLSGGLEFLSSLSNCKNLRYLEIFKNVLRGIFPDDAGNLSANLGHFDASENRINGNIPSTLGNLSNLLSLRLSNNELNGTIPSTLARLESLGYLDLSFNSISGLVPSELGQMKQLTSLCLQNNKLFGPIPESLMNISMLQIMFLSNNKFSANIPKGLYTLYNLLKLDISGNNLSGSLSSQVCNLKALIYLNLSMNQLSGNITYNLGELSLLIKLDLSKNIFQGQIPESFGGLISATYINLSYNYFSGSIPKSLANLSYLDSLDLSFNKLKGQVPNGRVFLNSSIPSLTGNEALCGAPQLHIPPCSNTLKNKSRRSLLPLKYILLATILGVALLMLLVYALYSKRKLNSLLDTNVPHLDHYRVISHLELVRATENFSETNLVGRGGFGSVYRGCLGDGLVVAIKVLNLNVDGSLKSFEAECQVLRMVRHKNLINIISVCSNLDFKALILEYMPNGSLERWLYSDNHFLNLIQRLDIMEDVSLALEYLHHHHPHVVLHCDLKPTNILLDEELSAYVSDFGIAKLMLGDSKSNATADMLGTVGYMAPEYAASGTISRMSDVYSFGILLLEMFTGKQPTSVFGEQLNLREWICKAHSNTIMDIMDQNILKFHETNNDLQKLLQCVSSVIKLGLLCSNYSPKKRMPMTDVTKRLQKIKIEYLSSSVAPAS